MIRWLKKWIIEIVIRGTVIGGHCGLCGNMIRDELFPIEWSWGICKDCHSKYGKGEEVETEGKALHIYVATENE